jgi:ABC-type antimicrobial peptide transport system permease subunit
MQIIKDKLPRLGEWLLKRLLLADERHEKLGDFEEGYHIKAREKGKHKALMWYWLQLIIAIPVFVKNLVYWRLIMFKNYLKITLRTIKRHKGYSFINIAGLSVGMTCCILIFLWVRNELSYDRFHTNIHELTRVVRSTRSQDGSVTRYAGTPSPLGPSLKEAYPGIKEFARFYPYTRERVLLQYRDKKFYEEGYSFADPSFFTLFTFPFVIGDSETALSDPHSVVITQRMAEKYFGSENPLGKTVTFKNWRDFVVSGVIEDIPDNSHIQFDFISPIETLFERYNWMKGWRMPYFFTYLLLEKQLNIQDLESKIRHYARIGDPEIYKSNGLRFGLQPVKDIRLHSNFRFDLGGQSKTKSTYITFFSIIAVLVLVIACINFMNLTTARSANRAKEIGIRKVSGAYRTDISKQFFGESLLMSLLSLAVAVILAVLLLPGFNSLAGKKLDITVFSNMDILVGIMVIAVVTGILSGFYPALMLSSYQPVKVMQGVGAIGTKSPLLRRILVIVQFTLSLILIIGTVIVYKQLDFMQNMRLGYEKEYILYFTLQGDLKEHYKSFKNELLQYPFVEGVTASSDVPLHTTNLTIIKDWQGSSSEDQILMNFYSVDHDFIETFGIELAEGRNFSTEFLTDATEGFIVNEEAVKQMGMTSPIGKRFSLWNRQGRIVGVMKNFYFKSLHHAIEPLILRIDPRFDKYVLVRLRSERIENTLKTIENLHNQFNPEYPFEFKFLDEEIDQLYLAEKRMKQIFQCFTGLAIFISCIGLFGLSVFMVERRTKEIGIRKTLGSSIPGIILLLSKDFTKWCLISNVFSWPVAFVVMNVWLKNFAYRVNPGIGIFALSGLCVFAITFLTISYQTIKAAIANPVDSLRYE